MEAGPVVLPGGSHNTDPESVVMAQRALHAQDSPAVPPSPTGGGHLPRTQQQQQQEVLHSLAARGDRPPLCCRAEDGTTVSRALTSVCLGAAEEAAL